MDKQEYVGRYLDRKLKNNKLPYGLQYLNLVAETEEKAEKAYKRYLAKQNKKSL